MTCMTVFAEAMAMPTMQLTRAIQYEDAGFRQLEGIAEHKSPRMSWGSWSPATTTGGNSEFNGKQGWRIDTRLGPQL